MECKYCDASFSPSFLAEEGWGGGVLQLYTDQNKFALYVYLDCYKNLSFLILFEMPYQSKKHKQYARELRSNMTHTEKYLWMFLRKKQFKGFAFRRQFSIGSYIVDFVCLEARLIIECDGGQHAIQKEYDKRRDDYLRAQGFQVLRFWDNEIFQNTYGVLECIFRYLTPPP